jgi:hypothetical protein
MEFTETQRMIRQTIRHYSTERHARHEDLQVLTAGRCLVEHYQA